MSRPRERARACQGSHLVAKLNGGDAEDELEQHQHVQNSKRLWLNEGKSRDSDGCVQEFFMPCLPHDAVMLGLA